MKSRSPLVIVFFTVFLDLLGFGILIPLLPFVGREFASNDVMVGLLMASYSVMQFIFSPIWGRLSDKIGRRPVILVSLVGSTIGYAIFALALSFPNMSETFPALSSMGWADQDITLTLLFVSRILSGIAAANISTAQAIIADVLPPEKRTKGMGMIGAAIGMGFVFGPALAGVFSGSDGTNFTLPFVVAACLTFGDLLFAYFKLPETLDKENGTHRERRRFSLHLFRMALEARFIPRLLIISLLYFVAFSTMESTFAFFCEDRFGLTARHNGFILFGVGVIMAVVQGGLVGRLSQKFGDSNLLTTGLIGITIGLFMMASAWCLTSFLVATAILAVSAGFMAPTLSSLISQLSQQDVQGGILGLNQSMASLGRIIGPLLGTSLYHHVNERWPFYSGVLLVLVALGIVFSVRREIATRLSHPSGEE